MATSPQAGDTTFFRPARPIRRDQVDDLLKLQRAAKKITSILDLDQLIDEVVHNIAASFGCLEANLYLVDESRQNLVLASVCGCTKHCKGEALRIGKDGMVGYVAATGQMHYAPDVSKDPYYMACESGTQSEVAIPLEVGGEIIGAFVASHHDLDAFPPEQLRLLQSLCSHIAVAVQNAQTFRRERKQREQMQREAQEARLIQEALLPKSSPYMPGFSVTGLSIPAGSVGGDWYDFIPLDQGRWGLVLADVSGKGTAAALLMSATRGMLRSLAEAACTPGEVLTKLNRLMVADFPSGRFVTMIYGVLDPAKRMLTFANAGHLPPLLVSPPAAKAASGAGLSGTTEAVPSQSQDGGQALSSFVPTESGLPLGLSAAVVFSESTVELPPGARLAFYSDGITEAENGDQDEYGSMRLEQHFAGPQASVESILEDVRSFAAPLPLRDDATVIVVKASA